MSTKDTWFAELDAETTRPTTESDLDTIRDHLGGTFPAFTIHQGGVRIALALPDQEEGFFTGSESAALRAARLAEKALAEAGLGPIGFPELHVTRGDRTTGPKTEDQGQA